MISALRFWMKRIILFIVNLIACRHNQEEVQCIRRFFLRLMGVQVGPRTGFSESLYILNGRNLEIGADCHIGDFFRVWDWAKIRIGNNLLASNNLTLVSASHRTSDFGSIFGPITIGDDIWIGINVTVIGPVTIGSGAVIGANSLVTKDVPAGAIYAGTPAKFIRFREGYANRSIPLPSKEIV
jgi:acetyltransferase-like isoleucine patch superfamily enzyme